MKKAKPVRKAKPRPEKAAAGSPVTKPGSLGELPVLPITGGMEIEMWPIERPIPYPKNARKWSDRAIATVAASIKEFGFRQPIVVDANDVIVIGHLRLAGAKSIGLKAVPVHVARDLTPAQIKGLNFDLGLTGFDAAQIDALIINAGLPAQGKTEDDAVPEPPATPVSVLGDLWLLGSHRVLCGDSTSVDATQRLCGATKAKLVFTDPPYNVDYEGYTEEKLTIAGDKMTSEQFGTFLLSAFTAIRIVTADDVSMYVCHASSCQREFQSALEAAGFEVRCQIIWAKNTFAWGFGRYKFQHEPIFYCHAAGVSDPWYGDKSQSTLWQENKPAANRLHPTMKPIALVERALVNSSRAGDVVLDVFGGSGSTLIACQKTGRKSLLMEIDPKYVDVIVRRWQEFTGGRATLDGDGHTFDELKTQRLAGAVAA